jgi:hypothetical protein
MVINQLIENLESKSNQAQKQTAGFVGRREQTGGIGSGEGRSGRGSFHCLGVLSSRHGRPRRSGSGSARRCRLCIWRLVMCLPKSGRVKHE